jgi:hypothetical protein
MKLYEFFGVHTYETNQESKDDLTGKTADQEEKLADEIYWFILDDDDLHKEYFIPLAKEINQKISSSNFDRKSYIKKWLPMVNKGCMKFYKKKEMTEDPNDTFTKEMRRGLCERLAEQFIDDIEKGEYKLG